MEIVRKTGDFNIFTIKPKGEKAPLSEANEGVSGFPWTAHASSGNVKGALVVLGKGVYIDDSDDLKSLFWLLREGAIVIVDNLWCVGENAVHMLAHESREFPGRCALGEMSVSGYSGIGDTESARAWASKHRLTPEDMKKRDIFRAS